MSRTYKATGINLKSSPLGESDRLLTILSSEYGLLRAVAPGARKHRSSLGGRSSLFVVNQLLIAKGRSLDKIVQAESLQSFPKISQDLAKLTAAQYLAELALFQALSDQPQAELLCLLQAHLTRLELFPTAATLATLAHATFQMLALAGLTPQLTDCCITLKPISPDDEIGFSVVAGGLVRLDQLEKQPKPRPRLRVATLPGDYRALDAQPIQREQVTLQPLPSTANLLLPLNAAEIDLLQKLTEPDLVTELLAADSRLLGADYQTNWLTLERLLRHYAQYHFDRPIRSSALIDVCFTTVDTISPA
ncbi:MAG: DNA repair protein RecO [Pegethrix bostrychoides GSE-TBD4-15B]|jgi:DNA repair protein RecO (recombination protein O)|uniref:DNA repair protein RecO n=1 Tax=Pegethrix bostrychoides GSE-TBD4-15B TaxID=2839662 RepID=A0A951PEA2_9CYAN|nr:DNA repair protein RecO [Pegethrix bostrychoides GSE-TBD4-15B]